METRTTMGRAGLLGTAAALGISMLAGGPAGAFAASNAQSEKDASAALVAKALVNVEQLDSTLLVEPASGSHGVGLTEIGTGTVDVPTVLGEGVTLHSGDGSSFTVTLPNSEQAAHATEASNGVVTYPGNSSANSVVVSEVGVQMLTTISGKDAPTRYTYEVDLGPGQRIELAEGGAEIVDADGAVQFAVGLPWAKDAKGTDIPTRYEVDGSSLTQIVDHTAIENAAYPVVADPIWLAPWVVKCLLGLGIKGPEITRIASTGSYGGILAAFGRAGVACVFGK